MKLKLATKDYLRKGNQKLKNGKYIQFIIILIIYVFSVSFLFPSCKTCKCPAYTQIQTQTGKSGFVPAS